MSSDQRSRQRAVGRLLILANDELRAGNSLALLSVLRAAARETEKWDCAERQRVQRQVDGALAAALPEDAA